jgi:leader peptidase (prepilin peptidase)/N-methyltransferase
MFQVIATIFGALFGLAFGSFLNVCLSRWPTGESVVQPRSHCRRCDHTLAWWENIPLLSWILLGGRCRNCHFPIGWRYPLVELATAALWAFSVWRAFRGWSGLSEFLSPEYAIQNTVNLVFETLRPLILTWLLVALATLDLENFWLPDWLTVQGAALGLLFNLSHFALQWIMASTTPELMRDGIKQSQRHSISILILWWLPGVVVGPAIILLIRWLYRIIRHREGMGLGDVKLMALLGAWLGLPGALLTLILGAVLGAVTALVLLAIPAMRRGGKSWATTRLPLGTFLCIGGIVSFFWDGSIIHAYLRWAGL